MAGTKKDSEKEYSASWGGAREHSGGRREGAGRKKLSESGRRAVQFSLQQNEIDMITELSAATGLNKSRFIIECVKFWKENHQEQVSESACNHR